MRAPPAGRGRRTSGKDGQTHGFTARKGPARHPGADERGDRRHPGPRRGDAENRRLRRQGAEPDPSGQIGSDSVL